MLPHPAPLAPLALLFALSLTACATPQLAEVPASLKTCLPEPPPPATIVTDTDLTDWIIDLMGAGQDCRSKLQHVVEAVAP